MIIRQTLDNGVRVVVEKVPAVRSVATGVWVDVGSRDETADVFGVSHFLEHLLFKGTQEWSAAEIARCFDAIGGEFNAFTSKEQTVFVARTLDENLGTGLDVLADITQHPAFRPDDIDAERQVVLEEINMRDDSPDEIVHEMFAAVMAPGHALGREVLGTRDVIASVSRDAIARYHADNYTADRFVIAAAGNVEPEAFLDDIRKRWGPMPDRADPWSRSHDAPTGAIGLSIEERDSEQVHLVLGVEALAEADERRHALAILNHIFGGGMSSRLFQKVREERGLVYTVFSFRSAYSDFGTLAAYAGTSKSRCAETLQVVSDEFDALGAGISPEEFEAARTHIKGALALSQEDTYSRMARIGRAELIFDEVPSMDDVVARIEAVTLDDVNTLAAELAGRQRTLSAIGPLDGGEFESFAGAGTGRSAG